MRCLNHAALFLSLVFTAGAAPDARAAEPRKPNVLMIVSDDLAFGELACFGHPRIKSPNLDRLATEGVRLTSFYVSWPACTPSRGSILTGRYPQRNGLYDMIRNDMVNFGYRYTEAEYAISPEMTLGMDVREVLISQPLARAGYACGAVGKWDGGRAKRFLPLARGFDFFYGFANTGIDYWTHERYGIPSMFRGNQRIKEQGYATDLFCREAMSFIAAHKDRPFFLYLPFNAPHGASNLEDRISQAPADEVAQYADVEPLARRTRHACVQHMDTAIGRILAQLKELKLEDDTLVIFFSDNGGGGNGLNTKLRGRKNQVYEGGLRVPFIARWPGKIPAGRTSTEFATTLEMFPTLLAATGSTAPEGVTLDGYNLLPLLAGGTASPRTEMFWQHREDLAARVGRYKWVSVDGKKDEVFDIVVDEGEQHDLSAKRPELAAELGSRTKAWQAAMDASEPRGPFRDY